MSPALIAMAGWAEGVAATVCAVVALILTGAGILLIAACVFRSVVLASISTAVCLILGLLVGPAAFVPPPETKDSDAHHWHSMDAANGRYALGLAVASVGCLGLVRPRPTWAAPPVMTDNTASEPRDRATLPLLVGFWALRSACFALFVTGGGLMALGAPPSCTVFLLVIGMIFVVGSASRLPKQA